jgi:hypothetical protein
MLNLLTTEERKLIRREYILRMCTVTTIFAFFTVVIALASILPAYFYATTEETSKETHLAALVFESERAGDDSVALELSRTNAILSFLNAGGEEKPKASEIVRDALAARPEGARVDTLSFDAVEGERVLTIVGIANTRATLIEYSRTLALQPHFLTADVPAADLAKTRNINFRLTVRGNF